MNENPYQSPQVKTVARAFSVQRAIVWLLAASLGLSPFVLVTIAIVEVLYRVLSDLGLVTTVDNADVADDFVCLISVIGAIRGKTKPSCSDSALPRCSC